MIQNKRTVAYGLLALLAVAAVLLTVDLSPRVEYTPEPEVVEVVDTVPAVPTAYGIPLPGFVVEQEQVGRGATFGDLLTARGVPYPVIDSLVRLGEGKFDVRRMRQGNPIAFVYTDDDQREPRYFVYEVDPVEHVV
ncbi:MAG: hypothetical protein KDC03_02550, partial [Flavobacteriales bacterium]|nr:hypothetical protein [Flavobacteriales bacterium]